MFCTYRRTPALNPPLHPIEEIPCWNGVERVERGGDGIVGFSLLSRRSPMEKFCRPDYPDLFRTQPAGKRHSIKL